MAQLNFHKDTKNMFFMWIKKIAVRLVKMNIIEYISNITVNLKMNCFAHVFEVEFFFKIYIVKVHVRKYIQKLSF